MIADELSYQICRQFDFTPTAQQMQAIRTFVSFMADRDAHTAMILRGSAGTGKTSIAAAIVKSLASLGQKMLLLAPTGRAAKVFSINSNHEAFTIHRRIYRERSYSGIGGTFNLNDNMHTDTLFIIDECSMISNGTGGESAFGSGRLLDDLIRYIYGGRNCRMLLIGDRAQLPPVGEQDSPALNSRVIAAYGLKLYEQDLNEVLRQSQDSGILYNATTIRTMITPDEHTLLPKIKLCGFADISIVTGDELIESLASSYSEVGTDETMVITRSNKRSNIYNRGIRNMVLGREEELTAGDMLMVVKNKYLDYAPSSSSVPPATADRGISFIANGDRACVRRVRNVRELYGFRFADVALDFPDYDHFELDTTVILDTLAADAPALTHEQQEQLYNRVMEEDYGDIAVKAERIKKMKGNDYFNAVQIKYAYAITCHKAQGGQWAHVYLDQGYMTDEMLTPDYLHWLYTAFTRATEKLYLVNWPETQTIDHAPIADR